MRGRRDQMRDRRLLRIGCVCLSTLLTAAIMVGIWHGEIASAVSEGDVQVSVAARSKEEIRQRWLAYKPMAAGNEYMAGLHIYEKEPKMTQPYEPGIVKREYIKDGINAVNFVRYLSGLPYDVQPEWGLQDQAQAAALVNALNNELTHYPSRPEGMEEELFRLGYKGTTTSNLYAGSPNFYASVLGYMSDSDTSNIDRVGHRRWIINPAMSKTMFGMVNRSKSGFDYPYSSMYAFDRSRAASEVNYDYIAWPSAHYFPIEMFNSHDAWSVSLNPEKYDNTKLDQVEVTITRTADGKSWTLDKGHKDKKGSYFNINTGGFGIPFCLIFRPEGLPELSDTDTYNVHIKGLFDRKGAPVDIEYETAFFDMIPNAKVYTGDYVRLTQGEGFQIKYTLSPADAAATGMMFESSNPNIVAVDSSGRIKAQQVGSATVTVKSYLQPDTSIRFQVNPADPKDKVSAWALNDYNLAKNSGIVDTNYDRDYRKPMDRYGFALMAVHVAESSLGRPLPTGPSPFEDTTDPWIAKAYHFGIIKGTSAKTFSPWSNISRQEAAVLLLQLYSKLEQAGAVHSEERPSRQAMFADDKRIAPWAAASVYGAVDRGLLQGVGGNKFAPLELLTREQTFVILQQVLSKLDEEK
ncbi:S-layer homology domain-containing protein [Paenibacillus sp. UMB4589-SE434]|uniref:S-layer homology domain-containing protein n=1 Tax=Paenibacillus sp. UMB4589-SE434 TaxID=3046314 RepID=UPI00254EBC4B|nr:S-layer homology domain-containing protein [Paenibacillus sp. UMB4589-SE434]MDK8181829.1 S-layer homology domain-containing protein [Paenibacillus sp. UMB4589-SE434]